MEIAVMSDVHGNYHALKRCVDYVLERKIYKFLFLGDYVSDCAYPREVMELLYWLNDHYTCWFIRGNREEYLLKHRENENDGWKIPSSASGSLLFTYESLTEEDFRFLESLKITGSLILEGYPEIKYCHGSFESSKGFMPSGSEYTKHFLENCSADFIFRGHNHAHEVYEYKGKKLITVGSIGVPWYYGGDTQFIILHGCDGKWQTEFLHLDYDKELAVRGLYERELDRKANIWAKLTEQTLLTGKDISMECVALAEELCRRSGEADQWDSLPEEYWQEAARQMGII